MALKVLLLRKQKENKEKELTALRAKSTEFETREAELTAAIEEVENDEQRTAVEEMVTAFESEREQHRTALDALENEVRGIADEIAQLEAAQNTEPEKAVEPEQRKDEKTMMVSEHAVANMRAYGKMSAEERSAFVAREDVKGFLSTVREVMQNKRAISNVGLLIPEVMLGLLRQNILRYSKLYEHVTVSNVRGEGRVLIAGDIPEAVWTECCGNINELSFGYNNVAFGCWKLAGAFIVCNANLEDSDIDLAAEILMTLGQSIGYTDDKTILYGTGSNMPLGIVARLAQTEQPAGYPATARAWADLHTSHVVTIANTATGIAMFQQIALAAAKAKGAYARGEKVWAMNETTYSFLVAQAMNFDASGAIAAGVNGTMPVLGGIIEVLPDSIIPDYNIIVGYMELYRLVERAGEKFASSDQVFFLQDQTAFKATVRWDGQPLIAEAFVVIGINGTAPTTSVTFAQDKANEPTAIVLPATASVAVGATLQLNPAIMPYGVDGGVTWTSGTAAKATVDTSGKVTGVATGSSVITATTANGLTATCTVTVVSA